MTENQIIAEDRTHKDNLKDPFNEIGFISVKVNADNSNKYGHFVEFTAQQMKENPNLLSELSTKLLREFFLYLKEAKVEFEYTSIQTFINIPSNYDELEN